MKTRLWGFFILVCLSTIQQSYQQLLVEKFQWLSHLSSSFHKILIEYQAAVTNCDWFESRSVL